MCVMQFGSDIGIKAKVQSGRSLIKMKTTCVEFRMLNVWRNSCDPIKCK